MIVLSANEKNNKKVLSTKQGNVRCREKIRAFFAVIRDSIVCLLFMKKTKIKYHKKSTEIGAIKGAIEWTQF